ncbi:hypothetical protein F2Q70_00041104 [Brassica cretica]|uniref:Poly(A) RNA polymerase mitochondrial-like central palm domain-containing protein n=1 Tax=Brassica cretica TaxID=69181 RepID=A0A8S9KD72_BRACR|nr:hypothetical protein F2Q70_00041104 [Brassica cretica]
MLNEYVILKSRHLTGGWRLLDGAIRLLVPTVHLVASLALLRIIPDLLGFGFLFFLDEVPVTKVKAFWFQASSLQKLSVVFLYGFLVPVCPVALRQVSRRQLLIGGDLGLVTQYVSFLANFNELQDSEGKELLRETLNQPSPNLDLQKLLPHLALAKELARKLIIYHVDDNVVAKVKSAASSSGRTRPPPHLKSQPVNAPRPQSKKTELLNTTLQEIIQLISPTEDDFRMRTAIITQLRDVLPSVKSLRGGTVEPYGSFVSNLHTRSSDMDISVVDFTGLTIEPKTKVQTQTVLRELYEAMTKSALWSRIQFIGVARVPIVKGFSIDYPNIPFDVSIDNVKGIMKSKFFRWISGIDSRFRHLVLLVKQWAKTHDINSSRDGTFNSYSLCLLVIFHLQTCVPAILPPLQNIYPRNPSDDLKGVRRSAEESIEKIAGVNIASLRSASTSNTSSISDLLLSFFEKFSDIDVKAAKFGVCTCTGRWENITDNHRWVLRRKDKLFVEDPFDQPENAAMGVRQLDTIANVFQTSSRRLASVTNRDDIVALLKGPLIDAGISSYVSRGEE